MPDKVRLARRKASVSSFRVVPERRWHEILQKWHVASSKKPGRVQLITDPFFHGTGLAAAEVIGPRGKRGIVSIARDPRIKAHEQEHVENLAWFRRRGILPARTSFLAVLEEFSMKTRMVPRNKRSRIPFIRIQGAVVHGGFSTWKQIQGLLESVSMHFPSDVAFRRARLSLLKSPEMKPHIEALSLIRQPGETYRYPPSVVMAVKPHLRAIVRYFEKAAQRHREKIQ